MLERLGCDDEYAESIEWYPGPKPRHYRTGFVLGGPAGLRRTESVLGESGSDGALNRSPGQQRQAFR